MARNSIFEIMLIDIKGNKYMAFMRSFDISKINRLTDKSAELFASLKADVLAGEVFPAVRKGELHFYYMCGCLYRIRGRFG